MIMYSKWEKNAIRFLAMTGYSLDFFNKLLPFFSEAHDEYFTKYYITGKRRKDARKFALYKNSPLNSIKNRLLFFLSYQKLNPIQEVQAELFDMTQKQCNQLIHALTIALKNALAVSESITATTEKELKERLSTEKSDEMTLFHDGPEREIPRPKENEALKEFYSGKKGRHTVKNGIIATLSCMILFVTASVSGSVHDKKMADNYYKKALEKALEKNSSISRFGISGFCTGKRKCYHAL